MMYQVYWTIPEIQDKEPEETKLQKNLKKAINTPKKTGNGLFSMFKKKSFKKDLKETVVYI